MYTLNVFDAVNIRNTREKCMGRSYYAAADLYVQHKTIKGG
jgi:hypothetical protein